MKREGARAQPEELFIFETGVEGEMVPKAAAMMNGTQ